MARTVVVYDKGDVVGHYEKGIGTVIDRENVGDLAIEIEFNSTKKRSFEEPNMVYLIKDITGRITGRTLRVYMTEKEVVDWANLNYENGRKEFRSGVQSVKSLCCMLGCKTDAWFIINTEFDSLPHRVKSLLYTVKNEPIVVAIRSTIKKITVVVGQYQSRRSNTYGRKNRS